MPRQFYTRSVVAMLAGMVASASASLIGVTALGVQVYDITRRELDLGLLGLAEFAPAALLVLVTGSVADRYNRKRISSLGATIAGIAGVGLALYAATEPTSAAPIFMLVLVFGVGRAFHAPANRALPADIVTAEQFPHLTARRAMAWQVSTIIGPVVSGALYAVDPVLPYVAMAVLEVIAAGSMFFVTTIDEGAVVPIEPPVDPVEEVSAPAQSTLREAFEGLRFIRRSPVLFGAISLDLFAVLFGGAVALLPAIAHDRLGVDAVGLGWLRAAGGIGATIVTLAIARRPITRHVGRVLLVVVALFGIWTIVLGVTTSFVIAFIAMAFLHGSDSASVFIRSTLVPLATPANKRGRVLAVESVFIGASNELGAFESGVVGQVLGASGAIVIGGAATIVIAGTYWVAFPNLRNVDRFPDPAKPLD